MSMPHHREAPGKPTENLLESQFMPNLAASPVRAGGPARGATVEPRIPAGADPGPGPRAYRRAGGKARRVRWGRGGGGRGGGPPGGSWGGGGGGGGGRRGRGGRGGGAAAIAIRATRPA